MDEERDFLFMDDEEIKLELEAQRELMSEANNSRNPYYNRNPGMLRLQQLEDEHERRTKRYIVYIYTVGGNCTESKWERRENALAYASSAWKDTFTTEVIVHNDLFGSIEYHRTHNKEATEK
jgi:hypothetical protein